VREAAGGYRIGGRVTARLVWLCASVPAVDPTIAAAWITGRVGAVRIIGTVATAIVGSRNTRRATEATVAAGDATTTATLAAVREDRLWDKRCAAYEDIIATLLRRQKTRQSEMLREVLRMPLDLDEYGFPVTDDPPVSFEDQARLLAYASDEVRDAFEATRRADSDLALRRCEWMLLDEEARGVLESANQSVRTRRGVSRPPSRRRRGRSGR
jgi:hypothetical protein